MLAGARESALINLLACNFSPLRSAPHRSAFLRCSARMPPDDQDIAPAPQPAAPFVPSDDLEIEGDPDLLDHGHAHDAHAPASAEGAQETTAPLARPPRPWHSDPNYRTLCEMRDVMAGLAQSDKRVTPKDRVAAARVAIASADRLIDWFGVESGDTDDSAEQAAVRAGKEAARRAVNAGSFGAPNPQAPSPWATLPGDPNPHRHNGNG